MSCVNIMVKSSDILKTPSQSCFLNKHGARTGGGGGELQFYVVKTPEQLKLMRTKKIKIRYSSSFFLKILSFREDETPFLSNNFLNRYPYDNRP